jgi:C1A family cysteine protease
MTMSASRYVLGIDVPDSRDYVYSVDHRELRRALPLRVDLRPGCLRVWDQRSLGTCTAHAVAAAFACEQRRQKIRVISPSRLFIYYNERALTHQKSLNCVVRLRDAIKAVVKRGVCPESQWPYSEDLKVVKTKPPKVAFQEATKHQIVGYHRIPIGTLKPAAFLQHLKHCLAGRSPFLFGFMLYESFETDAVKKSGVMPVPNKKHDKALGGHAVMAVGYDDRRKAVLVRNSWGRHWGIEGHFWMPYRLITNPEMAHDFWTVRGVTS